MSDPTSTSTLLAHPAPAQSAARMLLLAIRRMAIGGIDDAQAQASLLGTVGLGYRRPLVLLRALMLELSRAARQSILVAPPCCPRITAAEGAILQAIACADERAGLVLLNPLLASSDALGAAITACALGEAMRDLGRPLSLAAPD